LDPGTKKLFEGGAQAAREKNYRCKPEQKEKKRKKQFTMGMRIRIARRKKSYLKKKGATGDDYPRKGMSGCLLVKERTRTVGVGGTGKERQVWQKRGLRIGETKN